MQAAEDWSTLDRAPIRRLYFSWLWTVFLQPEMRPILMVVVEVFVQDPPKMPLVEDNHLIQALPPDRPDHPLDVRVLPRLMWRRQHLLDVQSGDSTREVLAVLPVSVS